MATVTLALHAMATRFELVLHGEDPVHLRSAGEEALREIERLEAQLSLYRPDSEIAHVNALAAREPLQVSPEVFGLLMHAQRLHAESGGAFDITIAPLVRCWGFMGAGGRLPSAEEVARAREIVGMDLVSLDSRNRTVSFSREGVMLDLGAIGKGYAVERAVELLREDGVTSALLHGGTSTVYGLGNPPEAEHWLVAIEGGPADRRRGREREGGRERNEGDGVVAGEEPSLAKVPLRDEALSVSAVWGRAFHKEGREYGHVLDPRTGWPVTDSLLAAVALPSATETDALSTALLTRGLEGHERLAKLRAGMRTLLVAKAGEELKIEARDIPVSAVPRNQLPYFS